MFFSVFYKNSFWLSINGNGGFVGNFLIDSFLFSLVSVNEKISYYSLLIITLLLFFVSINFNIKSTLNFFKYLFTFFRKKKIDDVNVQDSDDYNLVQEKNIEKNRIQEDLPFIKNKTNDLKKSSKFKLPSIEFLKKPSKKDKDKSNDEKIDESFLEKILLDFGVEGKIKKISHGPVVTLNEFEPAAGIKVSKIINLSEDIARNTSSESTRISMIPGSNTIGIEIPNNSRENVYLSEIISHQSFLKKANILSKSYK